MDRSIATEASEGSIKRKVYPLSFFIGLFLLFDGCIIWRPYAETGNVSIIAIIGAVGVVVCLAQRRIPFEKLSSFTGLLLIGLTLILFFSNYSYYKEFNFTIFNNLILYLLIIWTFDKGSSKQLHLAGMVVAFATVILICDGFYSIYLDGLGARGLLSGNARQIAFYILLIFPFLFLVNIHKDKGKTLFLLGLQILAGTYVIMSLGRLPIIILLAIAIFLSLLKIGDRIGNRSFYMKALFLLLCIGVATNVINHLFLHNRLSSFFEITEVGLFSPEVNHISQGRFKIYQSLWAAFVDHPIFGIGYLSWNNPSNYYNPFVRWFSAVSAHSYHLQILAETGLVGFTLYFILLFRMTYKGWTWLRMYPLLPHDIRVLVGATTFFVGLIFFLGGTFDNHGLQYRQIYFSAAVMTIYLEKEKLPNVDAVFK